MNPDEGEKYWPGIPEADGASANDEFSAAFINSYVGTARQAAEQALKSLDASINWALTSTLGIGAFAINASVLKGTLGIGERAVVLLILAVGLSILVHFGIRAAKNYLNVVRFAKLERESLRFVLKVSPPSLPELKKTIEIYHLNWQSPLSKSVIFRKVLFEFGFWYLAGFLLIMFCFVAFRLPPNCWWIGGCALLIATLTVVIEISIFNRSPYIKDPTPDGDATSKA